MSLVLVQTKAKTYRDLGRPLSAVVKERTCASGSTDPDLQFSPHKVAQKIKDLDQVALSGTVRPDKHIELLEGHIYRADRLVSMNL
jgi:hypothetical protein